MEPNPQAFSWPGTWNVELSYVASCDAGFGNLKKGMQQHVNPMQIVAGTGSALTADVTGYGLSGTGNSTSMTLSGQYPIRDHSGNVANNVMRSNNVTLGINTVIDNSSATGTVTGSFEGQFGFPCTISNGIAKLTR